MLTFSMHSDGEIRKSLHEKQACNIQAPHFKEWLLKKHYQIQHTIQQSPDRQDAWRKAPISAYQEEGQPAQVR